MGICEKCKNTMCRRKRDDITGCSLFIAKDTKVLTNGDRIRAMSDEELAEFIVDFELCDVCSKECNALIDNEDCDQQLLKWLKQPAEE